MTDTRQTDAALLTLAGQGDAAAAAALLDRLGPRLLAFCRRMTGGDTAQAEDIVQEAFLRLWQKAPEWDAGGAAQMSTWLGRVAANLAIDARRRSARMTPLDDDMPLADDAPSAVARLIRAEGLTALDAALAQLPERQRQALVLRHIEGYSNPDIAAMMGCGVEAVESLTARGKRHLAALLAPLKPE
ncbi:sigma-70 family RNA polymerase sigma factor [Jannaschia pohangensis]|uniref:RNA polymerase, sigma subunit, ECF family n=1 Tax=Jannaschia pohangensis TaxID=390807 RepID=A0A1I3J9M8_9RHOB|nr:sigma-70 family RNA polymerase sigma factor [Jannaschia pohangensis]SFI56880.1 RNA polymerase, sigma subunit, ECF family [Jannaschia pohangensis]